MVTRKIQLGQAMPIGIALIMFSILTGIVLFNTGQLVSEKTRLANTADSAVYSGLIFQTRALNFQSYTNRAMVANQVTMAQAVSLRSWTIYGLISAENINALLGSIPFVGTVTTTMQQIMEVTARFLSPITDGLLSFVDMINGVLPEAQTAMYAATFVATPEIVREVARKNDPNFNTDTAFTIVHAGLNAREWNRFTDSYKENHVLAMNTKADVVNRSRDRFTTQRDWEFFASWLYIGPFFKLNIHRRGETRLVSSNVTGEANTGIGNFEPETIAQKWEWKGKDTLSLNSRYRSWRGWSGSEVPVGWGQAFANSERSDQTIETSCQQQDPESVWQNRGCDRWLSYNGSAEQMSDNNVISLQGTESREKMSHRYAGIRAYRDLSNLGSQEKDPRLVLRVEIESPLDKIPTSANYGISDVFTAQDEGASTAGSTPSLASIASGEVYFKKPVRSSNLDHMEYANGYNPFWDVRLIDTPDAIRIYALLLRQVPIIDGAVPAAGEALTEYVEFKRDELDRLREELDALSKMSSAASDRGVLDNQLAARQTEIEAEISSLERSIQAASTLETSGLASLTPFDPADFQQAQQIANLDTNTLQNELDGYVRDQFDVIVDPINLVGEKIQDRLNDALVNILSGALQGAASGAVGFDLVAVDGDAETLYDDVNGQVDSAVAEYDSFAGQVENAIALGAAETARVEAEFKRIQKEVSKTFEMRKLELQESSDQLISAIDTEIADLEQSLREELPVAKREKLELELSDARQLLENTVYENLMALAEMLVEVVNSSTDLYVLDLETALNFVMMDGDVGVDILGMLSADCNDILDQDNATDEECEVAN